MSNFAAARRHMVDSQIRTNRVTDPLVIGAVEEIPRERFVDKTLEGVAYLDEDLPIAPGRNLMEPMVFSRLAQALEIGSDDVVLDVGCANGYSSAVLARLASTVVALETDSGLAARASATLLELGIDNVVVVEGPLADGHAAQAPYDAILVGGMVSEVPRALQDQIAEGGRLCAVIGADRGPGRATLMVKRGGIISRRTIFDAAVPALPGFETEPGFVF